MSGTVCMFCEKPRDCGHQLRVTVLVDSLGVGNKSEGMSVAAWVTIACCASCAKNSTALAELGLKRVTTWKPR